jgi:hypothetical protein
MRNGTATEPERGESPAVTLAGYHAQKLRWRPCDHGFQCARLLVPFDYQRPGWRRFSLPVIRLPATSPRIRIGSLVVNPGGPRWARALAGDLTSGVLLGWNGDGHTAYMRGSSCVDSAVDKYLVSLVVPRDGTMCP